MGKVWIVYVSNYFDTNIAGVFTGHDKAEECLKAYEKHYAGDRNIHVSMSCEVLNPDIPIKESEYVWIF